MVDFVAEDVVDSVGEEVVYSAEEQEEKLTVKK